MAKGDKTDGAKRLADTTETDASREEAAALLDDVVSQMEDALVAGDLDLVEQLADTACTVERWARRAVGDRAVDLQLGLQRTLTQGADWLLGLFGVDKHSDQPIGCAEIRTAIDAGWPGVPWWRDSPEASRKAADNRRTPAKTLQETNGTAPAAPSGGLPLLGLGWWLLRALK